MQYTVRGVPSELDRAMRAKARMEGASLNQVTVQVLLDAFGLCSQREKRRDLEEFSGSWVHDPKTEQILEEQRKIDLELWK